MKKRAEECEIWYDDRPTWNFLEFSTLNIDTLIVGFKTLKMMHFYFELFEREEAEYWIV